MYSPITSNRTQAMHNNCIEKQKFERNQFCGQFLDCEAIALVFNPRLEVETPI